MREIIIAEAIGCEFGKADDAWLTMILRGCQEVANQTIRASNAVEL
jgi:hypothetical protein